MLSGLPEGSVLRSLHILIIRLCDIINHSILVLLMTLKSIELLILIVIVHLYSQILIVYMNGVQQILLIQLLCFWSLSIVLFLLAFQRPDSISVFS
jgi:hypothetical protein